MRWVCLCMIMVLTGCDDTQTSGGEMFPDAQPRESGVVQIPTDMGTDALTPDAASDTGAFEKPDVGSTECEPGPELCNQEDDDCDGVVDEDDPQLNSPCDIDLPGACGLGRLECQNGTLTCTQSVEPMDEVCDEADNDCDGLSDENLGGDACETGLLGACAAGTQICRAGGYECQADLEPAAEVCNSIDDDCNGEVDDMADGSLCGCADERPTLAVQAACGGGGYQPTRHIGECAEETELHLVGQYTPADNNNRESLVRISRRGMPMIVVFSAYDRTQWRVEIADGVRLEQIIINGYEPSVLLDPPEGVEVVNLTGVGNYLSACAYTWPADDQGCDTPALVRNAQMRTGLPITSFQGCYSGAGFIIEDQVAEGR